MNDNTRRGHQWQKLIGDFFISRFGGTPEQWAEANRRIVNELIEKMGTMYEDKTADIPQGYYDWENSFWIDRMFEIMGIDPPENKIELSIEASKWITPQVNSSYPGIIDAIHTLAEDYTLYTASNEVSYELEGYLTGMGVIRHFETCFGADLLGAFKTSPLYFERIVEKTGVIPRQSVVIDYKITNLNHAETVGFQVIHSGLSGAEPDGFPYFTEAGELPNLIRSLQ